MASKRKVAISFILAASLATIALLGLRSLGPNDGDFEAKYYNHLRFLAGEKRILSADERQRFLDNYPLYKNATQTNICVGGQDPDKMTTAEYLKAFAEGPCSTFVAMGGLSSTLLEIQIDCNTLMSKEPEIFQVCGWTRCSWNVFGGSPKPEYRLWVPDPLGPLNVMSSNGQSSECFTKLFYLNYDSTKTGRSAFTNVEGVTITWFGNTNETVKHQQCGITAYGEMMEVPAVTLPRIMASWIFMNTFLRSMGYRSGLTLQMLPYDFRYPIQYNDASYTLLRSLQLLNALTGKKAVIAGHSLGVEMTVYFMSKMSQADKDAYVSSAIGIGGPFDGAGEASPLLFGGKLLDMDIWGFQLGMSFNDTMRFTETVNTALQMLPGDGYYRYYLLFTGPSLNLIGRSLKMADTKMPRG